MQKKGVDFKWIPACQSVFETLKQQLISAPVLVYPNFEQPFLLATDASASGLGAVLSQMVDGQERAVAYASWALHKAGKNCATVKKKFFGDRMGSTSL